MNLRLLSVSLVLLGMLCIALHLSGQVVSHPLLTLEQTELEVDHLINSGSVRYAQEVLRGLESRWVRAATDELVLDQARVFDVSKQPALYGRTTQSFIDQRSNSPRIPFVHAERGFSALLDKQWKVAASEFERASSAAQEQGAIRQVPEYKHVQHLVLFWLGVARANGGLFAEALNAFDACVTADTAGDYAARAVFAKAQLYERNANIDQAIASYAQVRTRYPQTNIVIAARLREAQMFLNKHQPERATDVLVGVDALIRSSVASDTSTLARQLYIEHADEQLQLLRTNIQIQRDQYAGALDAARSFVRQYPQSRYAPLIQLYGGYSALSMDSNAVASEMLGALIQREPSEASAIKQQAQLYNAVALQRLGRVDEARAMFADLSTQPDYPYQAQALLELGQLAYQRGDVSAAQKNLDRAERAASDPSTMIRARILLGAVYVEQQKWEEAAGAYARAEQLALSATDQYLKHRSRYLAEARLKKGICLLQQNERPAAIKALTEYLGSHPTDPSRDEGTFWLAEAMYRSDLLRNAQELYEDIVHRYTASPRREEAMYGLAWTYFRKREFDKSVNMFSQLVGTYPKSKFTADALVRQGDGLYITRRYGDAAAAYSKAARIAPSTDEGLYAGYQAGQAMYRAGRLDQAFDHLRQYASAHPSSKLADDALYLAGWIAFQQNNDAGAIAEFDRLLKAYPTGDQAVKALYTMADARYNTGDVQGAIDTYKTVISKYPGSPLAVESAKSIQMALVSEGRTDEALALADSWIAADPQGHIAQEFAFEKANIFYTGRSYKSAADELLAYMAKYPQSSKADEALFLLGKSYLSMNELGQAVDAFKTLETKHPDSRWISVSKLDLAEFHNEQARAKTADSLFAIVQFKYPTDTPSASRAGFERATIARLQQDTVAAMQIFRYTADKYPATEYGDQARYQLASHYRAMRQYDSARAELAVLIRTSPDALIRANALYDIGDSYARERQWPQAIEFLERIRTEYAGVEDWYTLALIGLGTCYEQLAQPDKAKEVYGAVAQLRPEDDFGKTAIARLKRLEKKR